MPVICPEFGLKSCCFGAVRVSGRRAEQHRPPPATAFWTLPPPRAAREAPGELKPCANHPGCSLKGRQGHHGRAGGAAAPLGLCPAAGTGAPVAEGLSPHLTGPARPPLSGLTLGTCGAASPCVTMATARPNPLRRGETGGVPAVGLGAGASRGQPARPRLRRRRGRSRLQANFSLTCELFWAKRWLSPSRCPVWIQGCKGLVKM